MLFPNKLRETRVVRRIRQIDLVVKTGINSGKISLVENGLIEAKPEEKEKLALALGVKIGDLWPPVRKKKASVKVEGHPGQGVV